VHWYRNIFSHVPSTKVWEIAAMLKAIHASEDLAAAREKANRVIEKLRGLRLSRAVELVETAVEETLTYYAFPYYAFPEEHWRRIRTNNPLERILREIRRRTRVVGAFPDGQSALNLAASRLRHIAGTAWSTKRLSEHRVAEGPADERCHHRVSQGRMPLSQPKVRKILDTTRANFAFRPACGTYL
jgi:putative transposase